MVDKVEEMQHEQKRCSSVWAQLSIWLWLQGSSVDVCLRVLTKFPFFKQ